MNVSEPLWFQCWALGHGVECHLEFSLLKPRIPPALSWDGLGVFLGLLYWENLFSIHMVNWKCTYEDCEHFVIFFCKGVHVCVCAICLSTDPSKKALLYRNALLGSRKALNLDADTEWRLFTLSAHVLPRGCRALRMNLIHSLTQHHFGFENQYLKTFFCYSLVATACHCRSDLSLREKKRDENHQ